MFDAAALISHFGPERARGAVPLAPFTTFKAGGPADWFLETRNADETVQALKLAADAGIPVVILGGGLNVLIGDKGIRGLVIRPRGAHVESPSEGLVRAEAGVTVNGLVRWTINHGLAGLERWAGTPGTIGGGIAGNAHFGGRLLGDLVDTVRVATRDGTVMDFVRTKWNLAMIAAGCNGQRGPAVASFRVSRGEPAELRERARASLAHRKQTQPLDVPSAGCIFQNPSETVGRSPDAAAAGALVDRAGQKGRRIGGARVSMTHANFIVNEGGAWHGYSPIIVECRAAVRTQCGIELQEEIVY